MKTILKHRSRRGDTVGGDQLVAIVALPNFTLMALGCITDTLRLANRVAGHPLYRWLVVGLDRTIKASSEVSILADSTIAEMKERAVDIVIVCGGLQGHLHRNRRLCAWLRMLDRRGAIIGATSTGIWPVAHAGLLDGRRCAVHWDELATFTENYPLVEAQPDIFVADGRRLTCSGGVAIVDMVLNLIAMQHSKIFAQNVADLLVHARIRPADEKQRKYDQVNLAALGPVQRAIALMEDSIETVLPIRELAARVGCSSRQLERLFRSALETTPKQHYNLIRLRHARKFLTETNIPISEIAIRCGYLSQPQFSAQFKKIFGQSPRHCRQTARV